MEAASSADRPSMNARVPDGGRSGPRGFSQQVEEFIDGQAGIRNDATKGAEPDRLMIWYDGTTVRGVTAKDHVAARRATEYEAGTLQGGSHLPAR